MEYSNVSSHEWEKIILKSDNAHFFHSPTWAKIMEKTYNLSAATRLYHINGKEILIPMMEQHEYGLKTFASMPGNTDQGGLFSESDITTDDFKSIANDIVGGRNVSLHIALSPFMKLSLDGSSPIKDEWKVKDEWNYVHMLKLEGRDFEQIWKNYNGKTRNSIRKAIKSGVETRDATSLDDFKTFYEIFSGASQRWGFETPEVPFKLLKNLYKCAFDNIKLSLAIKDEKIIAGLLSFPFSNTFYLFVGSFLPEYGTLNPSRLLYNNLIEQACQEGYKYFSFGPTGNLKHIKKVKEGFGAEKVEINRYRVYSNLGKILNKINQLRK